MDTLTEIGRALDIVAEAKSEERHPYVMGVLAGVEDSLERAQREIRSHERHRAAHVIAEVIGDAADVNTDRPCATLQILDNIDAHGFRIVQVDR